MAKQAIIKVVSAKSTDWYYTVVNRTFIGEENPEFPDHWRIKEDGHGFEYIKKSDCEAEKIFSEEMLEPICKPEYIYFGEKAHFDLEKALAGEPVVQRDGTEIIELRYFTNAGHGFNIYALAEGDAAPTAYTKCGKLYDDRDSQSDLFMKIKTVETFLPLYALNCNILGQARVWYDTLEESKSNAYSGCIGHLKGKWVGSELLSTEYIKL